MKVAVYKTIRKIIEVDDKFKQCNKIVDDPAKGAEWDTLVDELTDSLLDDCIGIHGIWEINSEEEDIEPIVEF